MGEDIAGMRRHSRIGESVGQPRRHVAHMVSESRNSCRIRYKTASHPPPLSKHSKPAQSIYHLFTTSRTIPSTSDPCRSRHRQTRHG